MQKPTKDKVLKRYISRVIQYNFPLKKSGVSLLVAKIYDKKSAYESDIDKLATKILRHLNDVGYIQVEVDKPKIIDELPTDLKALSPLINFNNDSYNDKSDFGG